MNLKSLKYFQKSLDNFQFQIFVLNIEPDRKLEGFRKAENHKQLGPQARVIFDYPASEPGTVSHDLNFKAKPQRIDFRKFLNTILLSISVAKNLMADTEPEILELQAQNSNLPILQSDIRKLGKNDALSATSNQKFQAQEISGLKTSIQSYNLPNYCKFNAYIKCLNSKYAVVAILPEQIPKNIGIYARNQLCEYLSAFYCFEFYRLRNQIRIRDPSDVAKFNLQDKSSNNKLTMK